MTQSPAWSIPCEDRDFLEWHQGCHWCAVWVLMLDTPEVAAAVHVARQRLGDALLPRHTRQPHITVAYRGLCQRGGHPAQEFDAHALRADVRCLQQLRQAPFTLQLAGASSFETVPYLQVLAHAVPPPHTGQPALVATGDPASRSASTPDGTAAAAATPPRDTPNPLQALHAGLNPAPPMPHADWRYVPHVTVGHYARRLPLHEAVHAMRLHDWQLPPMPITHLALVRYASADIAGPLQLEGTFDLRTQHYQAAAHALWPEALTPHPSPR